MEHKDAYDIYKDRQQDKRDLIVELRDLENKLKNETKRADMLAELAHQSNCDHARLSAEMDNLRVDQQLRINQLCERIIELEKESKRKDEEIFNATKRGDFFYDQWASVSERLSNEPITDHALELISVIKTLSKFL